MSKRSQNPAADGPPRSVADKRAKVALTENEILENLPERFRKVYLELSVLRETYQRSATDVRRLARSVFESVLELRQLSETERLAMLAELIAGYDPQTMSPNHPAARRTHLIRKLAKASPAQVEKGFEAFGRTRLAITSPEEDNRSSVEPLKSAPDLWGNRKPNEDPVAFLRRVYDSALKTGALSTRKQLSKLDHALSRALSTWLLRHPKDRERLPELITKSDESIEELIARLTSVFSEEEVRRVGVALQNKRSRVAKIS
jgi:hypothetical protein